MHVYTCMYVYIYIYIILFNGDNHGVNVDKVMKSKLVNDG